MFRGSVFVLSALCVVGSAAAGDLLRHARFETLTGEAVPYDVSVDRPLRGGLTITGEKITLENGNFTATVQSVGHASFVMSQVAAQGRMPLDEAFFADPITAAVNNFLNNSKMTIGNFKNLTATSPELDVPIKDIQLVHTQKALAGTMKAMMFKPEFKGKSSYEKATKKMTITVESVTLGGINVPLDLTFYVMGQVLNYPFVTLARPNVIIDLTPFLPNLGAVTFGQGEVLP